MAKNIETTVFNPLSPISQNKYAFNTSFPRSKLWVFDSIFRREGDITSMIWYSEIKLLELKDRFQSVDPQYLGECWRHSRSAHVSYSRPFRNPNNGIVAHFILLWEIVTRIMKSRQILKKPTIKITFWHRARVNIYFQACQKYVVLHYLMLSGQSYVKFTVFPRLATVAYRSMVVEPTTTAEEVSNRGENASIFLNFLPTSRFYRLQFIHKNILW